VVRRIREYWQRFATADTEKEEPADYDYESIKSGEESPELKGGVEREATKPATDQLGRL
jgi:hypothetical protein